MYTIITIKNKKEIDQHIEKNKKSQQKLVF